MKVLAAIGSALVLSNLAMAVMLLQRQNESGDQLARVEKNVEKGRKSLDQVSDRLDASERRLDDLAGDLQRNSLHAAVPAPAAAHPEGVPTPREPAKEAHPGSEPLSEAQRDAVKKEVEQAVKEKLGSNAYAMHELADPMATMEKELELNPSQKARIQDLMSQLEAEQTKVLTEGMDLQNPDKFDFSKINEVVAIQKKYDEAITRELDSNQQAKYADLKKQGKLPAVGGGGSVRFAVSSSRSEEKK